jgi:hypothetical protein
MGGFDDFFEIKVVKFEVSCDVKCALKVVDNGCSQPQNCKFMFM